MTFTFRIRNTTFFVIPLVCVCVCVCVYTCMVTSRSSTITSLVRKSAPIVALYCDVNFLLTYWFINDVLPTLMGGGREGERGRKRHSLLCATVTIATRPAFPCTNCSYMLNTRVHRCQLLATKPLTNPGSQPPQLNLRQHYPSIVQCGVSVNKASAMRGCRWCLLRGHLLALLYRSQSPPLVDLLSVNSPAVS